MSTDDQADPRSDERSRPKHVDVLASKVISVLNERQAVTMAGLRQFVLDHILRAVLSKDAFDASGLLAELRGHRLTVDAIIDMYVPAVARLLGDHWVDDGIGFADVTIGVLRLQSLLDAAATVTRIDRHPDATSLNALVLVPQGEQHFLGASVLSGQLRRIGCEVAMSFDEDMETLSARLMRQVPDIIMITCARYETLAVIAETVHTIRRTVPVAPVLALGGAIKMDPVRIIEQTDVDVVTSNVQEAVNFCASPTPLRRRS